MLHLDHTGLCKVMQRCVDQGPSAPTQVACDVLGLEALSWRRYTVKLHFSFREGIGALPWPCSAWAVTIAASVPCLMPS